MKTKITSLIAVGALALVAIGGAFAYNKVSAQAPTPTVVPAAPGAEITPGDQTPPGSQTRPGKGGAEDMHGAAQDTELAAALGITVEKLQAAYQTANAAALKEAVSKGLITQAQADEITANGLSTRKMHGFGKPGSTDSVDYDALLANALGITTDQLKDAQQQVEDARLADAVANGQMTQEQADLLKAREALYADSKFQANLKSAYETAVQQAVTDGVITQAQADQILAQQAGAGFPGFDGRGGMDGRRGGRGGHGGRDGGQNVAPDAVPQDQQVVPPTSNGL